MDQGPVDAGPQADGEFDSAPARSYTPENERSASHHRTGFRSASGRRSGARDASRGGARRTRRRSMTSNTDPPLYPTVGAVLDGQSLEYGDNAELKDDLSEKNVMDGESNPHRMFKFTLYETNARYWITGADITEKYFRLLRIDRTSPPGQIALFEDETVYTRKEMNDVLSDLDQGNKSSNGLRMRYSFWGLLGFIRFTEAYYMLVITKRKQAAMIGGHYVYQIEGTDLVPLTTGTSSAFARDRNPEESRFLGILNNLDLTKSFYFSYSYDITHSLQNNIIRQRQAINIGRHHAPHDYNAMFVWNHHLLKAAMSALRHPYDWCLPIIHGFLDQAALDVFGRTVYVTIIGRRSRFFAGARFLKRGINDAGFVANDVETEQIVAEKLTTSFHAPGPELYSSPAYSSYVQHRGSIPLFWTQDNSGVTPKPGIDVNLSDPFYQPAALHFDSLFERYGCQVYALNLIKAREKVPRESKLLYEYQRCIDYLNQSLPQDKQIVYKAYDMARMAKTRTGDVIGGLEVIAKEILNLTGFFHNGHEGKVQNGVARTNCIDCLDRTNAAQFVIGKHAFASQLKQLGVISTDEVAYDTDAVTLFTEMFHDHGDNIAMQYGGSHLVNTMSTYRKLNHWQNSSRDMMESFKRYYHNSFLDSQRQEAYNLFLGNYIWAAGEPMLWDLPTDYYLHHSNPQAWLDRGQRSYIGWYTPEFLETRVMPPAPKTSTISPRTNRIGEYDDYWRECYRPTALSSLQKVYSNRIHSSQRYLLQRPNLENRTDFSPFVRRVDTHNAQEKRPPRKGVKILDPHDVGDEPASAASADSASILRPTTSYEEKPSILREPTHERLPDAPAAFDSTPAPAPLDKTQKHLWTLEDFYEQSLNPTISTSEEREYNKYVAHHLNPALVLEQNDPIGSDSRRVASGPASSQIYPDYIEHIQSGLPVMHDQFGAVTISADQRSVSAPAAPITLDTDATALPTSSEKRAEFADFLHVPDEPLTVVSADRDTRRYRAYRQWLNGRSFFKQNRAEGEVATGVA